MFASCAKQMYDSRMHAVCVRSAVRFFFLSIYLHVFQIIQLILPLTKFFFQCQARLWEAQLQCVCVCFFCPNAPLLSPVCWKCCRSSTGCFAPCFTGHKLKSQRSETFSVGLVSLRHLYTPSARSLSAASSPTMKIFVS
jgi:hypothetical protein